MIFTSKNGTKTSRIYESLTRASRRRSSGNVTRERSIFEDGYRLGVYDALKDSEPVVNEIINKMSDEQIERLFVVS